MQNVLQQQISFQFEPSPCEAKSNCIKGTIIVKDLSRFGREQVEMGRLTQVVYPFRFIAIQERVDTLTGDGVEMMPSHNIFNEWYAAQTSKKIRAVWQSKAEHGDRRLYP